MQFLADGGEHRLSVLPSRLQCVSPPLLLTPASEMLSCTCPARLFSVAPEFECHALINRLHGFWVRAGWCRAQNTGRQSWLAESALLPAVIMMESSWKCEDGICKPRESVLSSVTRTLCLALGESIWSTRSSLGLPGKKWNEPRGGMCLGLEHLACKKSLEIWGALCYLLLCKEPLQIGWSQVVLRGTWQRMRDKNSSQENFDQI